MATNNIWGYISFGKLLEKLSRVQISENKPADDILNLLIDWEEHDEEATTLPVYKKFEKLLEEWGRNLDLPINEQEYEQLKELLIRLDTTLESEMGRIFVYQLRKNIQADRDEIANKLLKSLGQNLYYHLPQNLRDNLIQSGQCLALELPIAAAMLTFRCTEVVLRRYCDLIGVTTQQTENVTFGQLTKALREWNNKQYRDKQSNKVSKSLISSVNIIPAIRNDTMHNPNHDDDPLAEIYCKTCMQAIRQIGLDLEKRGLLEKLSQDVF